MKRNFSILFAFFIAVFLINCNQIPKGKNLSGELKGAADLNVFLDKVGISGATKVISNTTADKNGKFNFNLDKDNELQPGIYRLRVGTAKANLILNGSENQIKISDELSDLQNVSYEIEGSQASKDYLEGIKKFRTSSRGKGASDFVEFTKNIDPMASMLLAYQLVGPNGNSLNVHKDIYKMLEEKYPSTEYLSDYNAYIAKAEQVFRKQQSTQAVAIGAQAPDIELPSPDGKIYKLSDLKGKIVLLDFWASWCGPCRRENPHVVDVYKRYKDKGFTVFSVSLDGLDSRTKARYKSPEQLAQAEKRSRDRWIAAIEQDGLPWEYHVSDLKKWEAAPAAIYGVRSIPKTFLIDQDGKIASVDLRGAGQIENAIKALL